MNTRSTTPMHEAAPDREPAAGGRIRRHVRLRRSRRRPDRSDRRQRRLRSVAVGLVLVSGAAVAAPKIADAASSWYYVENDQVEQYGWTAKVWGTVHYWKASNNANHRYVYYKIGAGQQTRKYQAMCVGTKVMFRTETSSSTTGGSVTGGWSLTGPSGSVSGSYSRTKHGGTTSDGFSWKCPRYAGQYIRDYSSAGRSFHPTMEGKLTHVAFMACLSDDPTNPNRRWCTPWDVNAYGNR